MTYISVFAALIVAVVLLAQVGEVIRAATPVSMHVPLTAAGAFVVSAALLSLLTFKVPPFAMSMLAWRASMIAGASVGLLMFCFYVSGAECQADSRGKFSCRIVHF